MTKEMNTMDEISTKAGFVAVIGLTNAGKSTLVNRLTGTKVSIVTPKAQTTRNRVLGIFQHEASQIILVDTPGVFMPRRRLDRAMVAAAWRGALDADIIAVVVDARVGLSLANQELLAKAQAEAKTRPLLLILNKIDLIQRSDLLGLVSDASRFGPYHHVMMISALKGDGLEDVKSCLADLVPSSPWLFPEDQVSDMPMRQLAAEITREKLFLRLQQELPYGLTVLNEQWEERADGSVSIKQVIIVQRQGHKAIVLGKGGAMIKAIGSAARHELGLILERTVHLTLFVQVREKWQEDRQHYREWGLDYDSR